MEHWLDENLTSRDNGTVLSPASSARLRFASGDTVKLQTYATLKPVLDEYEALRADGFSTPFNSPAWLNNWAATQGSVETPLFVVARDSRDRVMFIWPMSIRRHLRTAILGCLGQEVFAVNLGCFAPDMASNITAGDIRNVFHALREAGLPFDAVHLLNQPETWSGRPNPMANLPTQLAPNGNYARTLQPNYTELYEEVFTPRERRNHARQRRRLQEFGLVEMYQATTTDEKIEILDTFFELKAAQLAAVGASDPFRKPAVRTFYRQAMMAIGDDGGTPVFCGLTIDGTLIATLIGVVEQKRFTTLMSAITLAPPSKASPGQQLLEYLVEELCEERIEIFDFGPGPSTQKLRWEMKPQPLYNTYLALTPRARPATWLASTQAGILRRIKNNDHAFRVLSRARARVAGR